MLFSSRSVRRLLTATAVLAMTAGLTIVSTIMFNRQFSSTAAPAPVSAAALDRVSGATLTQAINRLQAHLRAEPKDAAGWSTLGLAYVEQARLTADSGYYPKAEGVLRRSLEVQPEDNEAALTGQGALAAARHDFANALRFADQALEINEYSTRAHSVRVDALVELGRYDEAWTAVQKADSLRPGLPIFTRYAYVLELRGKPDQARGVLERGAESTADAADVAYVTTQLAELAWNRGDVKGADRQYAAALKADPTYLPAIDGRARARAARGDFDGAIKDRVALTNKIPLPSYVVALGELYEARGMKDKAAEQYAVVDSWARLARANGVGTDLETALIAADHGDPALALRSARAEWAKRHSMHVADAYAWALHVNGRDKEALGYADQAARTGYRSAQFLYHRGVIEKALGRESEARRDLTAALRLNPHFSELQSAKAKKALEGLS